MGSGFHHVFYAPHDNNGLIVRRRLRISAVSLRSLNYVLGQVTG
jgi:hypothetical protein